MNFGTNLRSGMRNVFWWNEPNFVLAKYFVGYPIVNTYEYVNINSNREFPYETNPFLRGFIRIIYVGLAKNVKESLFMMLVVARSLDFAAADAPALTQPCSGRGVSRWYPQLLKEKVGFGASAMANQCGCA